jgi:hypothetical protein
MGAWPRRKSNVIRLATTYQALASREARLRLQSHSLHVLFHWVDVRWWGPERSVLAPSAKWEQIACNIVAHLNNPAEDAEPLDYTQYHVCTGAQYLGELKCFFPILP